MSSITPIEKLKLEITKQQNRKTRAEQDLKLQLTETCKKLKPGLLVKSFVKDLTGSPGFKGDLLNGAISIGAGYISKKIVFGSGHNPVKAVLGNMLQATVSRTVAKHSETIKLAGIQLMRKFFGLGKHSS
jgi:hypothetical protein